MIRLVFLLRRHPKLSVEEFQEHWRDQHGPLMASHQVRLGILRYTQTHRLDDAFNALAAAPRGPMEQPYDGVGEVWWESEGAMREASGSVAGKRANAELLADEADFIDLPNSPLWFAHEFPQFSTSLDHFVARPMSGLVKAHFPLRHRPEMTMQEAQHYWHTSHGPLARLLAPALTLLRYQQVHRFETPLEAAFRSARGTAVEAYTGHAEMWFDRGSSRDGFQADELRRRAVEDEARFVDFARSSIWVGKEHVFVDRW
ncbi:EthD domain-containing protein [Arthrobacter sp. B6]|uniref:EthD domain-containing protein n=1 Tax=Arthrobacter sp. B6 TaxID=1570137 RepID=UPI0008313086|nr:EthD domain-containing protein [Arthrobacter sp. B6]